MSRLLGSSAALGAATLLSRVVGFFRELAYASLMGTGPVADAFLLAFQIPNLFRRLLGEGALFAAFVPILKSREGADDAPSFWRATNAVLAGVVVTSAALVALAMLGISVALETATVSPHLELMLRLLRVMFPYLLFVCVAAVFIGVLNARGHFFMPALGAVALNVVMIASVFVVAPLFGERLEQQVFALALGVLVAGLAQTAFQLPSALAEGWRWSWVAPWRDPTVREVARRMAPAALGVAVFQISAIATQSLAYASGPQLVSSFNYAVRVLELPQGVVGLSLATFLLTELSGHVARDRRDEFRATLRAGLLHLIFVNALATALLLALAEPIVRLLFERGRFDAESTERTAFALLCLAPGLLAFSMSAVLARVFYALGDTSTPMRIAAACLALNLVLVVVLLPPLQQGALGVANSATGVLNTALLLAALRRKQLGLDLRELLAPCGAVAVAAVAAGFTAWVGARLWALELGHAGLWSRAGEVVAPMLAATALYAIATLAMRVGPAEALLAWAVPRRGRKP